MKRTLAVITACLFAMSGAALAEDAHHPNDATKAPATAPANPAAPAMGSMGRMHEHMKLMQEQMGRIRAASDPKERERLMNEHMKTMQDSMSMMKGMMNCGMMQ